MLIEALAEGNTHSKLGTLFTTLGVDRWDPGEDVNKEKRVQEVLKGLRASDDEAASKAALAMAQRAAQKGAPQDGVWGASAASWWQPLLDALAADGWEYDSESSRLTPIAPGVSIPEELNGLEAELEGRGWSTARLHFHRAATGYGTGDWESANSQLRSFLEDFLPRLAEAITGKRPSNSGAAIQELDRGFLLDGEREFLKGLWALCSERGSHPGASSRVEATFRLMTATGVARLLLSRLS